jgi:hypothetical protein
MRLFATELFDIPVKDRLVGAAGHPAHPSQPVLQKGSDDLDQTLATAYLSRPP